MALSRLPQATLYCVWIIDYCVSSTHTELLFYQQRAATSCNCVGLYVYSSVMPWHLWQSQAAGSSQDSPQVRGHSAPCERTVSHRTAGQSRALWLMQWGWASRAYSIFICLIFTVHNVCSGKCIMFGWVERCIWLENWTVKQLCSF